MCGDPMRGAYAVPLALAVRFWTGVPNGTARQSAGEGQQSALAPVVAQAPACEVIGLVELDEGWNVGGVPRRTRLSTIAGDSLRTPCESVFRPPFLLPVLSSSTWRRVPCGRSISRSRRMPDGLRGRRRFQREHVGCHRSRAKVSSDRRRYRCLAVILLSGRVCNQVLPVCPRSGRRRLGR